MVHNQYNWISIDKNEESSIVFLYFIRCCQHRQMPYQYSPRRDRFELSDSILLATKDDIVQVKN